MKALITAVPCWEMAQWKRPWARGDIICRNVEGSTHETHSLRSVGQFWVPCLAIAGHPEEAQRGQAPWRESVILDLPVSGPPCPGSCIGPQESRKRSKVVDGVLLVWEGASLCFWARTGGNPLVPMADSSKLFSTTQVGRTILSAPRRPFLYLRLHVSQTGFSEFPSE